MYDVVAYGGMIAFKGRTSSYDRALRTNIRPGAVVLDIGAGPGIMSLLACRAGAARVYAVEFDDVIKLAQQAASDNGFSDRIEFIQAMTTDIDLPEKVDGIVTDLHGLTPLFKKSIVSILDARDRFLKPRGWIIPVRDTIWVAPVSSETLYERLTGGWSTDYGFNFERTRHKAVNHLRAARLNEQDLVAAPKRWAVVDYASLEGVNFYGELTWDIGRTARAHGLCLWFDCETSPGIGFSNSPCSGERHIYNHQFCPWPQAVTLSASDRVEVRLRADFVDTEYVWSWETRVIGGGRVKAQFRQSTFYARAMSPARLRKRAHTFVPETNEDFAIDSLALDLMRRKLSVGKIAEAIHREYPSRFKSWNAALTRAANLSERYSK